MTGWIIWTTLVISGFLVFAVLRRLSHMTLDTQSSNRKTVSILIQYRSDRWEKPSGYWQYHWQQPKSPGHNHKGWISFVLVVLLLKLFWKIAQFTIETDNNLLQLTIKQAWATEKLVQWSFLQSELEFYPFHHARIKKLKHQTHRSNCSFANLLFSFTGWDPQTDDGCFWYCGEKWMNKRIGGEEHCL